MVVLLSPNSLSCGDFIILYKTIKSPDQADTCIMLNIGTSTLHFMATPSDESL